MKQLQTSAGAVFSKLIVFFLLFTLGTPSNVLAQTKTTSSTPTLSSPLVSSSTPVAIDSSPDASSPVPETYTLSDFAGKVFFRGAGFNMGIDNPDQARRLTNLTLKNSISETCNAHELSDNGGHPRATLRSDAQHGLATEGTLEGYHWIIHSTGLIYKKDTLWTTTVKLENNPNNSVRILPVILDNFVTSSKPRSELRYLAILRGIKFFNTSQNGFGGKTLWFGLSPALRADGEILDVTITPNVTSFEGTRDYTNDVYIDVIVYDPDHWGHKGFSWYSASQAGNSISTTSSGDQTQKVMSQTLDLGIPLASKDQAFVGLFRYGYNTSSTTPFEYDAMQERAYISGISGNNLTVQMAGAVYGHNGAFATDSVRVMNPTELKGYVIYCKNPKTCRASINSLGYGSNNYWGTHEIVENQAFVSNENDCHAEVHYDITLDAVTLSSSSSSTETSSESPVNRDLTPSSTTDLTGSTGDSADSLSSIDRNVNIVASIDSTGPADTGSVSDSSDSLPDSDIKIVENINDIPPSSDLIASAEPDSSDSLIDREVQIVESIDSTGSADTGSDSDSADSLVNRDVEILPTLECSAGFVPSGAQNTSMAFAWSQEMGADATFSNVISPPYLSWNEGWCGDPARIVMQDPAVVGGPCHWLIGNDPRPTVTDMDDLVAKTNAHPTGHRALRPFNAYFLHEYDSQSNTWKMRWRDKFPNGQENLWFDDWMTQGYTTMRNWFLEYKQAGGELDVIILDFEDGFTWWQLSPQFSNDQELIRNWISLVQADPRWPALRDRLNAKAISVGYAPSVNFNDISGIAGWSNMDPRRYVWNDVMHERTAEALDHIVFDAARVHFPSVRGSEFEHYLRKSDTHRSGQYIDLHSNSPVGKGKVVGTHSVKETYGNIPVKFLIESSSNPMLPSGPLVQSNPPLINNAFDLLIFEHRFFRGMRAADFNTPVSVWITGNEPKGIYKSAWLSSGYADTDEWYIENIFHLGLIGVKDFLLFNPDINPDGSGERSPDGSGEQLVHDALDELDSLAGFSNRESAPLLTLDAPNWETDTYLLTGMRIHGWDIYRFTPRLPAEVIAACPATFKIEGKTTLPVPGASIYAPEGGSLSAKGYWLVVEADSNSDSSDSLLDSNIKIVENTNNIPPSSDLVASAEPDSSDSLPDSDVEIVATTDSTGSANTGSDSDSSDSLVDRDIKIVANINDIPPAGDLIASAEPDSSDSLVDSDVEIVATTDSTGSANTGSDSDSADSLPDSDIKIVENINDIPPSSDLVASATDSATDTTQTTDATTVPKPSTGILATTTTILDQIIDLLTGGDKPPADTTTEEPSTERGQFFVASENDDNGSNPVGIAEFRADGGYLRSHLQTVDASQTPILSAAGLAQVDATIYASGNHLYKMDTATENGFTQLTLHDAQGNTYSGEDNVNALCRYNGQLVIVGSAGGWIHIYDPVRNELHYGAASGFDTPQGCKQVEGDLFVIGREKIYRLEKCGDSFVSEVFFELDSVDPAHFSEGGLEANGGYLFYTNHAPDWNTGHLVAVDMTTRQGKIVVPVEHNPRSLAIDPRGLNIYVSQVTDAAVVKVRLDKTLSYLTGAVSTPPLVEPFIADATNLAGPFGLLWVEEPASTLTVTAPRGDLCGDEPVRVDGGEGTTENPISNPELDYKVDCAEGYHMVNETCIPDITTTAPVCGNGVVDPYEACDDALSPPDGFVCRDCHLKPLELATEPTPEPAPEDTTQTTSTCPNGILEADEECEVAREEDGDRIFIGFDPHTEICTSDCKKHEIVSTQPVDTVKPVCGNAVLEGLEQCELPNLGFNPETENCGQCLVSRKEGDSKTGTEPTPQMDDCGPKDLVCPGDKIFKTDGCHNWCEDFSVTVTLDKKDEPVPQPEPTPVAECGNNKLETGESCDGSDLPVATEGVTYVCSQDCLLVQLVPDPKETEPVCGNGVLEAGEQCDGGSAAVAGVGFDAHTQECVECQIKALPPEEQVVTPKDPLKIVERDDVDDRVEEERGEEEPVVESTGGDEEDYLGDEAEKEPALSDINPCGNGELDEGEICDPALIVAEGEGMTVRFCNYLCKYVTLVLTCDHDHTEHTHETTPSTTTEGTAATAPGTTATSSAAVTRSSATAPVATTTASGMAPSTGASAQPTQQQPATSQSNAQGGVSPEPQPQPWGGFGLAGGGCQLSRQDGAKNSGAAIFVLTTLLALLLGSVKKLYFLRTVQKCPDIRQRTDQPLADKRQENHNRSIA